MEEQRLRAIERALAKIDEGTYRLSDLSGDPIPKTGWRPCPKLSSQFRKRKHERGGNGDSIEILQTRWS